MWDTECYNARNSVPESLLIGKKDKDHQGLLPHFYCLGVVSLENLDFSTIFSLNFFLQTYLTGRFGTKRENPHVCCLELFRRRTRNKCINNKWFICVWCVSRVLPLILTQLLALILRKYYTWCNVKLIVSYVPKRIVGVPCQAFFCVVWEQGAKNTDFLRSVSPCSCYSFNKNETAKYIF